MTSIQMKSIAGLPTRAPSLGGSRNYHLDAMRAIAAMLVVFDHIVLSYFVPYRDAGRGLLVNLLFLERFCTRGAVIFFFVLSGYLVGTSVMRAHDKGRWSWANYLLSRFTRLWVVLIPALAMTALLDGIGRWNAITSPLYMQAGHPFPYPLSQLDSGRAFFSTLFFLQGIHGEIFGTNGAAWSLSYEFWFYILFPLAVLAIIRLRTKMVTGIVYAMAFIAVAVFSTPSVIALFPTWLVGVGIGVVASRYPMRSIRQRRVVFTLCLLATAAVIILSGAHKLHGLAMDYPLALFASGMIWVALSHPSRGSGRYAATSIFFSEMSYTLYLTHQPLIMLVCAFWLRGRHWPVDLKHVALISIPMLLSLAFAYVMYWLFESRTDAIRKWLAGAVRIPI